MKILLLPASYPPVLGGLQTVTHSLARHLIQRGHDVRVVTQRYPRSLPARERLDGVAVERRLFLIPEAAHLRRGRPDLFTAGCFYAPITFLRLVGLLRSFRPDVVNVHFPDGQIPFVLGLRRWFAFRLVVSLHGDEVLRWRNDERRATNDEGRGTKDEGRGTRDEGRGTKDEGRRTDGGLGRLRAILREADGVTACSGWLLGKAIELEPSVAAKGQVIHNGVDLARFQESATYSYPRPYILAYGRLTYDKGYDLLLDAFAQVVVNNPSIDLIVTGNGEEEAHLRQQAASLGIGERVSFWGRATPDEIAQLLNGCLFAVVPSRRETFGIVALEALAAGKPVLATRVGGLPEVLGEGDGVRLVDATPEALAEGLGDWLARQDELPLYSAANRQRAARFTWERTVEDYLAVYDV